MGLRHLINRYWLQDKTEDVLRDIDLSLSNCTNFNYSNIQDGVTRVYTVQIYSFDGDEYTLILQDDGHGGFTEIVTGVLNQMLPNTIDYDDNLVTLNWNTTYLNSKTYKFKLYLKYILLTRKSI